MAVKIPRPKVELRRKSRGMRRRRKGGANENPTGISGHMSGNGARRLSSGLCRTIASPSRAVHRLGIRMSRPRRRETNVSHSGLNPRPARPGNDGQLVGFFHERVRARVDRRSVHRTLELAAKPTITARSGELPGQDVSRR